MSGSKPAPAGVVMERTLARRWSPRDDVGGFLAIVAAGLLWLVVLSGVVWPLGDALARLEGRARAAPACPVPPGALASTAPAGTPPGCP